VRKPRVLAVDDTPANLVALQAVLQSDAELLLAQSGAEAIALLQASNDVDVILMDLQMPQMDGFEAAKRIKQIQGCEDIPIVFITAVFTEDPFVKRGYAVGGVDYFTKPYDPDLLRLKVSIYASFRQKAAILREREQQISETEKLLSAGRKLSAILESLPVGVLIADTQGRVCQTNDEVSRIFNATGFIEADAYGALLGWWSADGRSFKDEQGPMALALGSGLSSHNKVLDIRCLDGAAKAILSSTSPLFGRDGRVVGAVIVIQDITEQRKIGAEIEDRITRLVALGFELEKDVAQANLPS
jgi:PAS domain S-box-containing protein